MTTNNEPPHRTISERFDRAMRRGVARRGAFPFLVMIVVLLTLVGGAMARIANPEEFESYGDATWWALVTLATVGYGDLVPTNVWGRIVGSFIMILGVTFLSFLTATVTSLFISSEEGEREMSRMDRESEVRATLQRIEDRLAAIEARLGDRT